MLSVDMWSSTQVTGISFRVNPFFKKVNPLGGKFQTVVGLYPIRTLVRAERWVRKFSMGAEFIRGEDRYCLWLEGITPNELAELPTVRKRVEQVRLMRLESSKAATRKKAETPWLFDEIRYRGEGTYIGVPKVSSERRDYIPMGFVSDGMIPGNRVLFLKYGPFLSNFDGLMNYSSFF